MDVYDAAVWGDGDLTSAGRRIRARALVVAFSSDRLYPPSGCRALAEAMVKNGKSVTYANVPSPYGYNAFLVEAPIVSRPLRWFLAPD